MVEASLWPDGPPRTARTALQVHVSKIRAAAPDSIISASGSYMIDRSSVSIDIDEVRSISSRIAVAGQAQEWSRVLHLSEDARQLWRGEPLLLLVEDRFAASMTTQLIEAHHVIQEAEVDALLALGRSREALPRLAHLTTEYPYAEHFRAQHMVALYRVGRQADALRSFRALREQLAEVGLEPTPSLQHLEDRILAHDPRLGGSTGIEVSHNLPQQGTSFVGRETEIADIRRSLTERHAVTLTGGPGFGKTRIAIELGHDTIPSYADGVWLVELADASTEEDVAGAITSVMHSQTPDGNLIDLGKELARRRALLILDNCEQVSTPCARFVEAVLARGGPLRILSTSREPLAVPGERVWNLSPLETPSSTQQVDRTATLANPSVRLLVDRIRANDQGFSVTDANTQILTEISQRLAGIPLAIELAARWGSTLDLDAVAELLSDPEHGSEEPLTSLQTAIGWSLDSLAEEDRALARRLSILRGSFDLEDIHAIFGASSGKGQTASSISRIVDSSLLAKQRGSDSSVRYRMLAPIREALASQKQDDTNDREHLARHYLQKAKELQGDPFGTVIDLESVDEDLENIRLAIEVGLEQGWNDDVAAALIPVSSYHHQRYRTHEAQGLLRAVLQQKLQPDREAHALRSLGSGQELLGEFERATSAFRRSINLFRSIADKTGEARCLLSLAGVVSRQGKWDEGFQHALRALELASDVQSDSALATAEYYMGECRCDSGDLDGASTHLSRSAEHFRRSGEIGRASYAMSKLAVGAVLCDTRRLAQAALNEAVTLAAESGSEYRMMKAASAGAIYEARWGDVAKAAEGLRGVHRHAETDRPEVFMDVVLPSISVLGRVGDWDRVVELATALPRLLDELGLAIPVPWVSNLTHWKSEADAALAGDVSDIERRAALINKESMLHAVSVGLERIAGH